MSSRRTWRDDVVVVGQLGSAQLELARRVGAHVEQTRAQRRQKRVDVLQQQLLQRARQMRNAAARRDRFVHRVRLEVGLLVAERGAHRLVVDDVLLRAIDDANIAELERNHLTGEHRECIGAGVHDVELGDDAERALAGRIDIARQLERVRVGEIGVAGSDGENDGVVRTNEVEHHVANLHLDVGRLIADRHTRDARQVDKSQIDHFGRVHFEIDGRGRDALVGAGEAVGFALNFTTNFRKVSESNIGFVKKFAPFLRFFGTGRGSIGRLLFIG
jgi:hypothetical protein